MHAIKSRLPPLIKSSVRLMQRLGVSAQPRHFYSDIPDFNALARHDGWRRPWSMVGVRGAEIEPQAEFAARCLAPVADRLRDDAIHREACARNGEGGYGPVEAAFLYGLVRTLRPARIVQIGCGVSTAVILQAAEHDPGCKPRTTCVEPYPTEFLRRESAAGRIELLAEPAQSVALDRLTDLAPGDLLFVDSTHTVTPGSEVLRIAFEVMPRLRPGVMVHFHDIYFPYDYSPGILRSEFFTNRENVALLALLTMNPGYRILASQSMLHHARPEALAKFIPFYRPVPMDRGLYAGEGHFPSAIFLERRDADAGASERG